MKRECAKTNTGEHWWLRLIGRGRKCYFCGKIEDAPKSEKRA